MSESHDIDNFLLNFASKIENYKQISSVFERAIYISFERYSLETPEVLK